MSKQCRAHSRVKNIVSQLESIQDSSPGVDGPTDLPQNTHTHTQTLQDLLQTTTAQSEEMEQVWFVWKEGKQEKTSYCLKRM